MRDRNCDCEKIVQIRFKALHGDDSTIQGSVVCGVIIPKAVGDAVTHRNIVLSQHSNFLIGIHSQFRTCPVTQNHGQFMFTL